MFEASTRSWITSSAWVPPPSGSPHWPKTSECTKVAQPMARDTTATGCRTTYQLNPHFGGWADVEDFSRQLHARGMRYIQDITLNDSNPLDNHVYGRVYNADEVFSSFFCGR